MNLKVIACQSLGVPFQVCAKAHIKTAKHLKGRTLGVTSLTSGLGIAPRKHLTTNGLKEADVTLVPLGSVPNALAALAASRRCGIAVVPLLQEHGYQW